MPRTVKEWIGATDDTPIPPRVKNRVRLRSHNCCEACGARVPFGTGDVDHKEPVINSTPERPLNRESNLQYLCKTCHKPKTRTDVARKSADAKTQKHLAGFKTPRRRPWAPTRPLKPWVKHVEDD